MTQSRCLPPAALLALSILLLGGVLARSEEAPQLRPSRDVDIAYDVTRPNQPKIRERVRWLASEHLQRVDGPDKATTIFNRDANEITLLVPRSRAYRKLEGAHRQPPEPATGVALKRGSDASVAGLHCTEWSWMVDDETHTVCLTADGVLVRLVIDGQTIMQARAVTYARQPPELFEIPKDYAPALAPEGGPAD
jgi:hypothetical protein